MIEIRGTDSSARVPVPSQQENDQTAVSEESKRFLNEVGGSYAIQVFHIVRIMPRNTWKED
jgi:hypothetical protein